MKITVIRDAPGSPDGSARVTYDLPDIEGASISSVLQYINRYIDGSLAYYLSCRRGLCVCCTVKVAGKIETACVAPARDGMVIEPVRSDRLIKDTVVDLSMARSATFDLFGDDDAQVLELTEEDN